MAKKYAKFLDPDHEVKTFRWPYWLLPLLFLSLLLVLGLFIFITIHSTDRFGCFFNCGQKIDDGGVPVPDDVVVPFEHRRGENTTDGLPNAAPQLNHDQANQMTGLGKTNLPKDRIPSKKFEKSKKYPSPSKHKNISESLDLAKPKASPQPKHGQASPKQDEIIVCGKIYFPKGRIPKAIPNNSHLVVEFVDTRIQDASSIKIASTEVDLSHYKKGTVLKYKIKCSRPKDVPDNYDVSAVLNMGWKRNGDDWLEEGDYFTDTAFTVKITKDGTIFEQDINLVFYS